MLERDGRGQSRQVPHSHGAQNVRGKEGTNQAGYAAGRFLTLQ